MSLFQCEHCGCCENTALGFFLGAEHTEIYDWKDIEERSGKKLCSACAPAKFDNGDETGFGYWHDHFDRTFLPMGKFKTNQVGALEHIETGSEDFHSFAIDVDDG